MCNWKAWIWPGILTVAVLAALALWMKTDFIQNDLQAKALSLLGSKGHSWAAVNLDGRDATLTGEAPSEEAQAEAAALTKQAYAVRIVDNKSGLLAEQNPYSLSLKKSDNALDLNGFLPNEPTRAAIVKAAGEAIPGIEIKDNTTLARGAPEQLSTITGFVLTQLSGLTSGEALINNTDLTVRGVASSADSFETVTQALTGELPGGASLVEQNILPPAVKPYDWAAEFDGAKLVLSGHVPNQEQRTALTDRAKSALPAAEIVDNMEFASGAPESFGPASGFAVEQLERFGSGRVSLSDAALTVSGTAKTPEDYSGALAALKASNLPEGTSLAASDIKPANVSPYEWSARFDETEATLSGFIPSERLRQPLVDRLSALSGKSDVTDTMKVAAGNPAGFETMANFSLDQLVRFSSGSVALQDEKLSVSGVARSTQDFRSARDTLAGALPEGMTLHRSEVVPPTIAPFIWGAEVSDGTVKLTGYVPDAASRAEVIEKAQSVLPSARIEDAMQVAAGASPAFQEATDFALEQLPRLSGGKVGLNDLSLSISGVAKTVEDYSNAKTALAPPLPAGLTLAEESIVPPTVSPYTWGARFDGKSISMTGFVPDKATRLALVSEAKRNFPDAEVTDTMQIAAGAPENFSLASIAAIGVLPRFSEGEVGLEDKGLTVKGTAKGSGQFMAANRFVSSGLPAGTTLAAASISPPIHKGDYTWQAQMSETSVVLSGVVPSLESREGVATAVRETFPGKTVVNRLTVEGGAPAGFDDNIGRGLTLLGQMKTGIASIINGELTVDGVAGSVASYEAILAQKGVIGGTVTPANLSPYTWSVSGEGERAVLSGFVPNLGMSNTNQAAAEAVLGKVVDNQQRIAAGQPEGFGNAAAALIKGVSQLENGGGSITGTSAVLQGVANSEEDAERIGKEISDLLPSNYVLRNRISYRLPAPPIVEKEELKPEPVTVAKPDPQPQPKAEPASEPAKSEEAKMAEEPAPEIVLKKEFVPEPVAAPADCEIDFRGIIGGETIEFDTARAVIKEESFPLLNRLAAGIYGCSATKIEIGGHTDARGGEAYNRALSEARANAVRRFLLQKPGITPEMLSARGYGESNPIAPNTPQERAKNRRIEFNIIN